MQTVPRLEVLEAKAKRYPQMDPVACEAYLMLRQVGDCMRSTLEKRLAVEGISHGRFMLLAILDRQPEKPLPASELAEDAGLDVADVGVFDLREVMPLAQAPDTLETVNPSSGLCVWMPVPSTNPGYEQIFLGICD